MGSVPGFRTRVLPRGRVAPQVARQQVLGGDAVREGQAPRALVHVVQRVGVGVAFPGSGANDQQRRTLVGRHVLP